MMVKYRLRSFIQSSSWYAVPVYYRVSVLLLAGSVIQSALFPAIHRDETLQEHPAYKVSSLLLKGLFAQLKRYQYFLVKSAYIPCIVH
jgi:hypothetical protein